MRFLPQKGTKMHKNGQNGPKTLIFTAKIGKFIEMKIFYHPLALEDTEFTERHRHKGYHPQISQMLTSSGGLLASATNRMILPKNDFAKIPQDAHLCNTSCKIIIRQNHFIRFEQRA
jgi:hypothetical protein